MASTGSAPMASTSAQGSSLSSTRPAVSMKVQKILHSSSYKNSETLAALETLASYDLLESEGSSQSVKGKGLDATRGASAAVNLRRSVERRLGTGAREFLDAFKEVNSVWFTSFFSSRKLQNG